MGLSAAVATTAFWVLGYSPWKRPESPRPADIHRPEAGEPPTQFTKVEFIGRKGGEKQYHFNFDTVSRTEDDGLVTFQGLREGIIYQDSEPVYFIVANTGSWLEAKDNFELEGDITVTGTDELTLRSEKLHWDGKTQVIIIPVPAELTLDDMQAESRRMEAHMQEDRLYLQGDVIIRDGELTIWADEVIYDRTKETMYLIGPGEMELVRDKT